MQVPGAVDPVSERTPVIAERHGFLIAHWPTGDWPREGFTTFLAWEAHEASREFAELHDEPRVRADDTPEQIGEKTGAAFAYGWLKWDGCCNLYVPHPVHTHPDSGACSLTLLEAAIFSLLQPE